MAGNGDSGGYGGDEEPTPAEPSATRVTREARIFANLGLEHSHVAECMWAAARLYDSTEGDDRAALLARLIVELGVIIDATTRARASLMIKKAEATK